MQHCSIIPGHRDPPEQPSDKQQSDADHGDEDRAEALPTAVGAPATLTVCHGESGSNHKPRKNVPMAPDAHPRAVEELCELSTHQWQVAASAFAGRVTLNAYRAVVAASPMAAPNLPRKGARHVQSHQYAGSPKATHAVVAAPSPLTRTMFSYLPADAKEKLALYVYRSEDRSYLYNHMWRPLCRKVVHYLPVWLAPNIITVAALAFVGTTHGLLAYYMPKLTVSGEHYLTCSETGTTPLQLLLDNLDGHQARRTGTSSPLGMLMDHGCDAVNCIIGALSVATAVSAGPSWKTWLIVLNTVITFFLNTWEEYYRGVLVLPVINGPNEGILIAIGVYLWTAWVGGPQWWYKNAIEVPSRWLPQVLRQPAPQAAVDIEAMVLRTVCPYLTWHEEDADGFAILPFLFNLNCTAAYRADPPHPTRILLAGNPLTAQHGEDVLGRVWSGHSVLQRAVLRLYGSGKPVLSVRYNTLAVALMTVGAAVTSAGNVYQVYRAIRRTPAAELEKFGGRRFSIRFPFLHALSRLVPLVVVTFTASAWLLTSNDDIFRRHPRIFCWTVGLLYTKLAIHLMLAHLCSADWTALPYTVSGSATRSGAWPSRGAGSAASSDTHSDYAYNLDEELALYELFALSTVTFAHLAWSVVRETAALLQVPIFTVPREKQKALRAAMEATRPAKATATLAASPGKLRKGK
ncbi:CDP-alcohol phosphatidyltransferase family protein [Leishmania donovani]|uniref:CDP-alcohol phosphatidyltransferase family protein n=1 Tax=Leishmania donovani TaxID=5661 RepID=A0A504XWN5_LEIDO|nr:CDP-alcohol phosphatidyltransferase family protein [Leishmania donovani]